jgi:hypothetical protein
MFFAHKPFKKESTELGPELGVGAVGEETLFYLLYPSPSETWRITR